MTFIHALSLRLAFLLLGLTLAGSVQVVSRVRGWYQYVFLLAGSTAVRHSSGCYKGGVHV